MHHGVRNMNVKVICSHESKNNRKITEYYIVCIEILIYEMTVYLWYTCPTYSHTCMSTAIDSVWRMCDSTVLFKHLSKAFYILPTQLLIRPYSTVLFKAS